MDRSPRSKEAISLSERKVHPDRGKIEAAGNKEGIDIKEKSKHEVTLKVTTWITQSINRAGEGCQLI